MPSSSAGQVPPTRNRPLHRVFGALPAGDSLSRESWHARHAWICRLLWAHALVLPAYGIAQGQGAGYSLLEVGGLVGALALMASSRRLPDPHRSLAATAGLVVSSAVLIHFSGGLIEMHFHFFVVVIVVSLYQSWAPFLVALGVVLLHHGTAGTIDPALVYNHPAALARPWLWALIHAGFILAASVACLVTWRLNEDALDRERRAHGELAAAQQLAATGSWEWDTRTDDLSWSAELHRLFQADRAATTSLATFLGRVHPEDRDRVASLIASAHRTSSDLEYECRALLPDGTTRTIHVRGRHVPAAHGPPVRMRGTCQDITERKALEQEIQYRAFHDGLTGLANRSLFMDRLEHALAVRNRTRAPAALLYLDLDGFKAVNDRHGHHAGDQLLVAAARRLQRCVRDSDTLARLGGDEFAIILSDAGVADAQEAAERVHRELAAPLVVGDASGGIAASIGIAEFHDRHRAPDDLLREADAAMYAAKAAGKGRHEVYAPGIEDAAHVTLAGVVPVEAIAWADYMRRLRREIADRKLSGQIPARSRAPEVLHRTLEQVLVAIDKLAADGTSATLALPPLQQLEEFIFHQTAVQHWADALMARGTLTVDRTPEAERFWILLERQTVPAAGEH